jgi:GNAT superfamily N-acetyltransferase
VSGTARLSSTEALGHSGRIAATGFWSHPPVSQPATSAEAIRPPLQLVRLPVDKPQVAVSFLHARSQGVMDLIAHFWERLAQTPPLQRSDLHLIVAAPNDYNDTNINISQFDGSKLSGAMLYVPKAHRADVLALDAPTATAFASYITHRGNISIKSDNVNTSLENTAGTPLPLMDLSSQVRGVAPASELPGELPTSTPNGERVPIDFLTGHADGIGWMVPLLLPIVHRKSPARQLVNVVMQLPPTVHCESDPNVRLAKESDVPTLNRWRRQYKEERGILFDADLDAGIQAGRIFVYEHDKQVVAVAKFDLELQRLIEIGGVYTFPEFRQQGFGGKIVSDLACRIRQTQKTPTLQVDVENEPALKLYESDGWKTMGRLARVWLTG